MPKPSGRSSSIRPTFGPGHTDLARALEHIGRVDEAIEEFVKGVPSQDGRPVPSPGLASYYAVAGDTAKALDWLERAFLQRDEALVLFKVHPRLDVLRGEPRFRDRLARMRLEA